MGRWQQWQKALQSRYRALSRREQWLVGTAAVLLLVGVFDLAVWSPASAYVEKNRGRVARLDAELTLARTLSDEAARLKRTPVVAALPAAELEPLVTRTLTGKLAGNWQLSREGEEGVRISGEVPFDEWMRASGELALAQVRVVRLDATATGTPGMVRLDAVLVHAGGQA